MAKQRTIDPDLFTHPLFRRASFIERELWIGLIVNADDEGRVRADAITLAETIFSPLKHGVTEDAISQALAFWQENGWILLYADNCIFLTGWYEHQYINKERRDPSGLPAPPCLIGTWEKADAVFTWYADKEGARKTHYRTALRAFYQLSEAEQEQYMSRTCSEHVLNILAPASKGREGNRTERKGRTTKGKGLAPPIGDAPSDNAVKPLTPQQQIIQEAYAAYPLSGKSTGKGYSGVATAVSQYGIPAVQEWIDWLRENPQTVPEGADPWAHFCLAFRAALSRPWEWKKNGNGNATAGSSGKPPGGTRITDYSELPEYKALQARARAAMKDNDDALVRELNMQMQVIQEAHCGQP